ncbi:hypothetical protein FACS189479_05570 [Spirochaetia bacterium]|nr:hypothetical protein FACS189479_05570 [Spirochaetia bacterium]
MDYAETMRKKQAKKAVYEQMSVHLPRATKRRIRFIAAEMELPIGRASEKLIELGLEEYLKNVAAEHKPEVMA